jgi:hypothetical protein
MKRPSESALLAFCCSQRSRFDLCAWAEFRSVSPLELATAVRYLAGTTWYGHQKELQGLADKLSPSSFPQLAQMTGFDPSRFAGLLKARLQHQELREPK